MTLDLARDVEKYKMKCVALQEIRWKDAGIIKISQTTIFNGKCEHVQRLGTGFVVNKSIIHTVREFRDINPRISTLTLKTDNFYMVLINVHAPTEEKEYFYATLVDEFDSSVGSVRIV